MSTFASVLNQILRLEQNDEYFMILDKLIVDLRLADADNQELDLLLRFMKKLVLKKPDDQTLLLINGIVNELNQSQIERFLSIYSFFFKHCESKDLRKEIIWFRNYQKKS